MNIDFSEELKLDFRCDWCLGSGKSYAAAPDKSCAHCEGEGYHLTEFGRNVLEFVKRNLKVSTNVE